MCSIIACHFCQYYGSEWAWWLNVGVQVFFIISGFLYGTKQISEPIGWLKKQFKKILIPYYIFLAFAIVGYILVSPEALSIKNLCGAVLTIGQIKGISHLWFVSYILFCYLITPYLGALRDYLKDKSFWKTLSALITVFSVINIIDIVTSEHFRPGMIDCYILGFYIAVFKERWGDKTILLCFLLSLIPTIASNTIYCYLHYTKGMDMTGNLVHITDFSHLFLGLSVTTLLMMILKDVKQNNVIQFSDKYSYEIYLVHQLFILSPLTLLTLSGFQVVNIFTTLITILITGVTLQYINLIIKCR